jgi:trimethylamine--corrinoid protein Co-methyltransferase
VLECTGIEVMDSPCREEFRAAGARIDEGRDRLHIGAKLVEQGLERAARRVMLAGRDAAHDLELAGAKVYMGTGGQAVKVLGLEGVVRESALADNYHISRLCDALEQIHFHMRPVVTRDLATEHIDINQFYTCLAATTKHVMANAYCRNAWPSHVRWRN